LFTGNSQEAEDVDPLLTSMMIESWRMSWTNPRRAL